MKFEERNVLENKEVLIEQKKLIREVIAFLNYHKGGVIYLGIDNDENVVGIVNYDDAQLKIKDWIRDMIRPNALEFVDIVLEQINEKYVIKIDIKSGDRKPYYLASKGRIPDGCFIRTANGVESMDEDMIEHAMMNSYGPKRRELKDIPSLNTDLTFEILKTKLISKGIHINEKTFLKNYNLITEDGRFNKLADLLADENRVGLAVCVFKGKNKVEYLKRNEYGNVSLVYSYQRVIEYCEALNETYVDVSSRPRKEKRMFDNKAFEEAWINACVHNLWEKGEPAIYWYENRMEIVSHGGIPEGLTEEKFLDGVSEPVNPDLMEIFKSCGFVEKSGHGVPLVVEAYGKEAFDFDPYRITVTIPFDKTGFKNNAQESAQESAQEKSNNEKIFDLLKTNPNITRKEIIIRTGLSDGGVKKIINRLKEKGIVKRVGSTKGGHWEIVDKGENN